MSVVWAQPRFCRAGMAREPCRANWARSNLATLQEQDLWAYLPRSYSRVPGTRADSAHANGNAKAPPHKSSHASGRVRCTARDSR
jgi:hypothetical protein